MSSRALSPGAGHRRRAGRIVLMAALFVAACGGGGAAIPTGVDEPQDTVPPEEGPPPADTTTSDSASTPAAPSSAVVTTPDKRFDPASVTIRAGGTVTWVFTDHDHDVTFTGPVPPGGNIPETDDGTAVARTFPEPGTYTYLCAKHADDGMIGEVVVVAGGDDDGGSGSAPPPSSATVTTPGTTFSPATVRLAEGGTVTWNITGARHNVTFTGPAPPGGNVPDTDAGGSASRTFTAPGRYAYVCTRHSGMNGTVQVEDTP